MKTMCAVHGRTNAASTWMRKSGLWILHFQGSWVLTDNIQFGAEIMDDKRIIKKYPNRRLYDTEESKYITIEDIKKLVLENKEFIVKDVKSEEDLTRTILLQIIIEQEDDGEPLFTTQTLSHIIRFYGDSVQSAAGDYLQKSIDLFVSQQKQVQEQLQSAVTTNPISAMAEITEQNLDMWKTMQENFFKTAMQTPLTPKKNKEE
ncbi:MAG: polyhydroxyalkanoate synthesis repressor PhaR [Proteobacteria bacterium]|nr:polyhydroxyalkanoate synthesis repressor PhaR [Pseudomonadota bacterium]